ncbi:MAG: MFS transporter [Bryobacter sp.]|jgi:MFS family permease|nr:MFS transporter [Bryobacter sp. CoA8 C33]
MPKGIPYRWELVGWLWLAFFFNQADRQVFAIVLPQLKVDLGLTDIQAGWIAGLFTASLAVTVPVAGYLGDLWNRRWLVSGSLFSWSASTLLTAFAASLGQLIGIRSIATGAGEAVYAPAANALIGEHHRETRAQAMAIHQTSLYCGVVASGLLAGWLADRFGWRSAFVVFGAVGILLSLVLALRLRDSRAVHPAGRPELREIFRIVVSRPTLALLTLGFSSLVFVNVGYLTWMPTYLHEQFGQSLSQSGFSSMFYHHAAAFAGVMLGGRISDAMAVAAPRRRLLQQSVALIAGAPFIYGMGAAGGLGTLYVSLALFGFCRGLYEANTYTTVFEVVEARYHASISGLMICFAFLTAAAAPIILGALKQAAGLSLGIRSLSAVYIIGGVAVLGAALFSFEKDHKKVSP